MTTQYEIIYVKPEFKKFLEKNRQGRESFEAVIRRLLYLNNIKEIKKGLND